MVILPPLLFPGTALYRAPALHLNIQPCWKGLPGINSLAYCQCPWRLKQALITLSNIVNVIIFVLIIEEEA